MFIELVDVLRCPNPHAETWLVLAADEMDGRDIMSGTLGCPICHTEFRIVDGVARFDEGAAIRGNSQLPDEDEAVRLAALLDLTDLRGYAILVGETGRHAPLLRAMTDVPLMVVDSPSPVGMGLGVSGLTTPASGLLPLASGSARAVALDDSATPEQLADAVRVLAQGGRLLAPLRLVVGVGLSELARDERHWLAERASTTSGVISLSRRR